MRDVTIEIFDEQQSALGEIEVTQQGDFPLAISMSLGDLRDISKRSGTYSKTFKVPASSNNNKLLNYLYNANVYQQQVLKGQRAKIKVNGIPVFSGLLRIKRSIQSNDPKQYELEFVGDNLEWVDYFKEHSIRDLEYSHPAINSNTLIGGATDNTIVPYGNGKTLLCAKAIEASWAGTYNSGWDFVYSLKHYGQLKDPDHVVQVDEMRPDVYVIAILEKAFATAGYTIDSSFLASDAFRKLVLPFVGKGFVITGKHRDLFGWKVKTNSVASTTFGIHPLVFDTEVTDPMASVSIKTISAGYNGTDLGTAFSVPATGMYKFNFKGQVRFSVPNYPIHSSFDVYLAESSSQNLVNAPGSSIPNFYWKSPDTAYHKYKTLDLSFETELEEGKEYAFYNVFSLNLDALMPGAEISCELVEEYMNKPFLNNTPYKLNEELPDIKLIELLSDLVNLFDLYISTDTDERKVLIEPRNSFYKHRSTTINWSEKLDLSKEVSIQFLNSYKRNLHFTYKDDSKDQLIKNYKADQGKLPASLLYQLNDRYPSGIQKMGPKKLAFTVMGAANEMITAGGSAPYIPYFWGGEGSPPEVKYDFAPRILRYEGFVTQSYQGHVAKWKWRTNGVVVNKIPSATSVSSVLNLEYNGSDGLVNRFYLNDLKNLEEGKIIVVYCCLNTTDMLNIDLRTPIYIDQQHLRGYYYINKIVDHKPNSVESTKVELIRAYPPELVDVDLNLAVDTTSNKTTVGIGAGGGSAGGGANYQESSIPSTVLQNGSNNWALLNSGSTAIGVGLQAHGNNQHLQGSYNTINATDRFQVGVGSSNVDRYRGLTFTDDGNFLVQGGYMYTSTGQEILFTSQRTPTGQPARFDKLHIKGNN